MRKVLGLGNALVDILVQIDDDNFLAAHNLPKGSMQLVDAITSAKILTATEKFKKQQVSGGSAANTINGLAQLGVSCGYIGCIGEDETASFFRNDMETRNIQAILHKGTQPSGVALALVSKDSERTFATQLGSAIEMSADKLKAEDFAAYDYFHIEGYLLQNHELIEKAVMLAKKNGLKVSLDLASYNIVEENIEFLLPLIQNYVDILFANEEEAKAFTGKEPEEALEELSNLVEIAVVKVGKNGSLIKRGNERIKIQAIKAIPIDTTGAGDLYASGFLYGLIHDYPLEKAAKIGSLLAGNVVEVMGPKMQEDRWGKMKAEILLF